MLLFPGAFVPVTMEGRIAVDGVLASCYASYPHDLAHWVITPMKLFPKLMEWIFGDYSGFPGYVMLSEELGKWLLPRGKLQEY